jgi:hypothetical protein
MRNISRIGGKVMPIATGNLPLGELARPGGRSRGAADASSQQSRYVAAMEVAAALALEMAAVAKAAAELASAYWMNGPVMSGLSDDVAATSTQTLQAAVFAKKIAENDCA